MTEASLAAAIEAGDARRREVAGELADRRTDLPLRYWRQAAHLTTPAADAVMARKAVEGGTAPVERMLERLGFRHAPWPHPSDYARGDVYMEMKVGPDRS